MINGMPAAYTTAPVRTSRGFVDASVVAYQWDSDRVYHFVMLTQGGTIGPFTPMVNSLRRISAAEAAAIQPKVIRVVTVAQEIPCRASPSAWPTAISSSSGSWR